MPDSALPQLDLATSKLISICLLAALPLTVKCTDNDDFEEYQGLKKSFSDSQDPEVQFTVPQLTALSSIMHHASSAPYCAKNYDSNTEKATPKAIEAKLLLWWIWRLRP